MGVGRVALGVVARLDPLPPALDVDGGVARVVHRHGEGSYPESAPPTTGGSLVTPEIDPARGPNGRLAATKDAT